MTHGETTVVTGRRSRRTVVGGVVAVGVLAAFVGGGLAVARERAGRPAAAPVQSDVSPVPVSKPPFTVAPVGGRLGKVVETGMPASPGTEWVLSFVPPLGSESPDLTISLSIGERDQDGTIIEALAISDDRLTDHAAGFHPMQAPMQLEHGLIQPAFGYYVGRPATIKATFDGVTPVAAQLVPWSEDPDVTIFWFDPREGAVAEVSDLGAFTSAGARMPDGTIRVSYF
jgi:hypothetical protein